MVVVRAFTRGSTFCAKLALRVTGSGETSQLRICTVSWLSRAVGFQKALRYNLLRGKGQQAATGALKGRCGKAWLHCAPRLA